MNNRNLVTPDQRWLVGTILVLAAVAIASIYIANTIRDNYVYIIPAVAFAFWAAFSIGLCVWQSTADETPRDTSVQSQRAYKNFEFFIKTSLAIAGGFLLVLTHPSAVSRNNQLAMRLLGSASLFVAFAFSTMVTIHFGSKIMRWKTVEWTKFAIIAEVWMCILMIGAGIAGWFVGWLVLPDSTP